MKRWPLRTRVHMFQTLVVCYAVALQTERAQLLEMMHWQMLRQPSPQRVRRCLISPTCSVKNRSITK